MTTQAACNAYAVAVQSRFASLLPGREEDQLRRPVDDLLEAIGNAHGFAILAKDESPLAQVGRPDVSVSGYRLRDRKDSKSSPLDALLERILASPLLIAQSLPEAPVQDDAQHAWDV